MIIAISERRGRREEDGRKMREVGEEGRKDKESGRRGREKQVEGRRGRMKRRRRRRGEEEEEQNCTYIVFDHESTVIRLVHFRHMLRKLLHWYGRMVCIIGNFTWSSKQFLFST